MEPFRVTTHHSDWNVIFFTLKPRGPWAQELIYLTDFCSILNLQTLLTCPFALGNWGNQHRSSRQNILREQRVNISRCFGLYEAYYWPTLGFQEPTWLHLHHLQAIKFYKCAYKGRRFQQLYIMTEHYWRHIQSGARNVIPFYYPIKKVTS